MFIVVRQSVTLSVFVLYLLSSCQEFWKCRTNDGNWRYPLSTISILAVVSHTSLTLHHIRFCGGPRLRPLLFVSDDRITFAGQPTYTTASVLFLPFFPGRFPVLRILDININVTINLLVITLSLRSSRRRHTHICFSTHGYDEPQN